MLSEYNEISQRKKYFTLLQRRIRVALLLFVLCLTLALLWTITRPTTYSATSQVAVLPPPATPSLNIYKSTNLANEIQFAQSDPVQTKVAEQTSRETEISITWDQENLESQILLFTATSNTPAEAVADVDVWVESYIQTKKDQAVRNIDIAIQTLTKEQEELIKNRETQIEKEESTLFDSHIATLAKNISEFKLAREFATSGTAEILQKAQLPEQSNAPSLTKNLALAVIAGLLLSTGGAILTDRFDTSIRKAADLKDIDIPIIGLIPRHTGIPKTEIPLATMRHGDSQIAEAYRKMRAAIEFSHSKSMTTSILVVSPNTEEGKTSTAVNIAWAMSALKNRVILADVNYRSPNLHKVFGCSPEPGISNHVSHKTSLKQIALRVEESQNNLILLPSGDIPASPGQFISSPTFSSMIDTLAAQADTILFDAPPLLPYSDALTLASQMDTIILVAKIGKTKIQDLQSSIAALTQVGADITGICLVGCDINEVNLNKNLVRDVPLETAPLLEKHQTNELTTQKTNLG